MSGRIKITAEHLRMAAKVCSVSICQWSYSFNDVHPTTVCLLYFHVIFKNHSHALISPLLTKLNRLYWYVLSSIDFWFDGRKGGEENPHAMTRQWKYWTPSRLRITQMRLFINMSKKQSSVSKMRRRKRKEEKLARFTIYRNFWFEASISTSEVFLV